MVSPDHSEDFILRNLEAIHSEIGPAQQFSVLLCFVPQLITAVTGRANYIAI